MYKNLTSYNLADIEKFAAVLAHSDSCPDCELALKFFPEEFEGVTLYLMDWDLELDLCDQWEIWSVPTVVFVYNGKKLGEMWGLQTPVTNKGFIQAHLEWAKRKDNK